MTSRSALTLVLVSGVLAPAACRSKGNAKVGDKHAFTCAEVPTKDVHEELDLGAGARLVRDGVRAELRGVDAEASIAVTSFDGAWRSDETSAAPKAAPSTTSKPSAAASAPSTKSPKSVDDHVAALWVVGLGGMGKPELTAKLRERRASVRLVVAVAGPGDDVEALRGAVSDAGSGIVDGGAVRAVTVAGMEIVAVPGSDDAHAIADHDRGCVLRADDVRALAGKLGAPTGGRPRIVVSWARPARDGGRAAPLDALSGVALFVVGGPLDAELPSLARWPTDAGPALLPAPRAAAPRTTSAPGVVAPGMLLLDRTSDGALRSRFADG